MGMVDKNDGSDDEPDGSESEDSESGPDPYAVTPTATDQYLLSENTESVQTVAGDSATVALNN